MGRQDAGGAGSRQAVRAANSWKGPGGRPGAPETPSMTGEAEDRAVLAPLGKEVQQGTRQGNTG